MPWKANGNSEQKQSNCLKRGKTRATKSWSVLVLYPIGWESGTSFPDQSRGEVKAIEKCSKVITSQSLEARENAGNQVKIGCSFNSDW